MSLYTSEETLRADTLFSALCHETLVQQGEAALERLCESVRQGKLLFSDTMPWYDKTFYLPKPIAASESTEEVETTLRKKVKKMAWIPVLAFDRYAKVCTQGILRPMTSRKASARITSRPRQISPRRETPSLIR